VAECQPSKLNVASSNLVSRSGLQLERMKVAFRLAGQMRKQS
jgi:hypothetical protein